MAWRVRGQVKTPKIKYVDVPQIQKRIIQQPVEQIIKAVVEVPKTL